MRNVMLMLIVIFSPTLARADTMTLVDNSSVNGTVVYLPDTFQVTGRFRMRDGYVIKTYQIKRDKVKSVRINNNTNNPGPPPPGINKYEVPIDRNLQFPTTLETKRPTSNIGSVVGIQPQTGKDLVKLKDNSSKSGTLTYIKAQEIGLDSEKTPIQRARVLYINIGQ